MPIRLDQLFQQVSPLDDDLKFHVSAGQDLVQGSGLHGLKKLSFSARRAENQAAVQAFMQAVAQHPAYGALLAGVRAPLDELMNSGRPLTAGMVKQTMLAMNLSLARQTGARLEQGGQLPAGHASAFGQFAAMRGLPLQNASQEATAIREYLLCEVCDRYEAELTALPDMGNKNDAAKTIMSRLHGQISGRNGLLAVALNQMLAGGVNNFRFDDFTHVYADACAADLAVLNSLSAATVRGLAGKSELASLMATFREALPAVGADRLEAFRTMLNLTSYPTTRQELVEDIVRFTLDHPATQAMKDIMTQHGLPASFAEAVGHHDAVRDYALQELAVRPGRGNVPSAGQLADAVNHAVARLTQERLTSLHELHALSQNPPAELDPPLTPETMARYVNPMLALDAAMAPVLNDDASVDAAFLQHLTQLTNAVQSSAYCMEGALDSDGWNSLFNSAIRLFLARKGVSQDAMPELATRAMNRFGALARECACLNGELGRGRFGAGEEMLHGTSRTLYRALEQSTLTLISLMNDQQRSAMHLDMYNALPADHDRREVMLTRQDTFIRNNFQRPMGLDDISDHLRDFARGYGVQLPAMSAASAAKAASRAALKLEADNFAMVGAVLSSFIPGAGQAVERNTAAFRELLTDLKAHHPLASIDADKVDVTRLAPSVRRAVNELAAEATKAGNAIEPAVIRAAAEEMLFHGLERIQDTLNAIDALPEKSVHNGEVTGFSPEEKAAMKDAAQRFGIRDARIIASLAGGARTPLLGEDLHALAAPSATARQLCQETHAVAGRFLDTLDTLPKGFEGEEDALAMLTALTLTFQPLSREELASTAAGLNSETARDVAGSLTWLRGRPVPARNDRRIAATLAVMDALHTETNMAVHGSAGPSPVYNAAPVSHPSEVPGGSDGIMAQLAVMGGRGAVSEADISLSHHVPPLTRDQWNTLHAVIEDLNARAQSSPYAVMLPEWITSAADEVLTAVQDGNGAGLSAETVWDTLTGGRLGPMPDSVQGPDDMAEMVNHITGEYRRIVRAATRREPAADGGLMHMSNSGVSLKKLLELTRPDARLTLNDIHADMSMSSMRDITPENAYGLTRDFSRQGRRSIMTFTRAGGATFSVQPHAIPREENTPDNPEFRNIIQFWRHMTKSEEQFRRLAHSFTQAPLISARVMSEFFPGVHFSEHGSFNMNAQEQADGSVVVDITSVPGEPLLLHEQFVIQPDGSHRCTAFDMHRPALNPAQGAEDREDDARSAEAAAQA
ncbi:hypothetical protein [Mailhella massiliensis]|uniref:hypothetical protein n=1 Tax=Mailhella massiliensis TaxID=1903261 RepID=UPI0023F128B7|nr:hypothetical protein [Mailhella massiliensis]